MTRREFLQQMGCAIGIGALGPARRIFAAAPGWTAPPGALAVIGVVSDTHLRTGYNGVDPARTSPHTFLYAALEYFRNANVDAVIHCGDMAHRGQVRELEFHREAWEKFFPGSRAPDGRKVEKLFVTGNHETDGWRYGTDDGFKLEKIFPDPAEREKRILAVDLAAKWEKTWGEKYEPVWHKEVKGFHFFARHHGVPEMDLARFVKRHSGRFALETETKPFFLLSHVRPHAKLNRAMAKYRNAVSLFGHFHQSAANWNVIHMWNSNPAIQIPACNPRGKLPLGEDGYITKAKLENGEREKAGAARQGYVIRLYSDKMVVERREFGEGGSLGADWIMPFGRYSPHPFSREELQKAIGAPEFKPGAAPGLVECAGGLKLKIPLADGNPASRAYAYEIQTANGQTRATYAAGCNMGIGRETNGGITEMLFPAENAGGILPLTITPLSSLGTRGKTIRLSDCLIV